MSKKVERKRDDYMSGIGKPMNKMDWLAFLVALIAGSAVVILMFMWGGG